MYDKLAREDDERAWRRDGEVNGWVLPPKAAWPLRLPVIRTIRAMRMEDRADAAAAAWAAVGVGVGQPNPRDRWLIYAVWRGWC